MPDIPYDPYTAARNTAELVGRTQSITAVTDWISKTTGGRLIHFVGRGGIGKTRLLAHLLKVLQERKTTKVAQVLVDLYHAETSTIEGLIHEICQAIDPEIIAFSTYRTERTQWEEMRAKQIYSTIEMNAQRSKMLEAFIADLNVLGETQTIIFALDTAEKLDLQNDPLAEQLGVAQVRTDTVAWLCNKLNTVNNVVVLLAGRQGSGRVAQVLEEILGSERYHAIELNGLTEEEALAYFAAINTVLANSKNENDRQAYRRLKAIPEEMRRAIFYCFCDAPAKVDQPLTVRPILLALAIDLITVAAEDEQLIYLRTPLAEARQLNAKERSTIQKWLGQNVINVLSDRMKPADLLVCVLGWLRKGATAAILEKISGLPAEEFAKGWQNLSELSFIKQRERDKRYFLHDEMYTIVQEHLLSKRSGQERERIFRRLVEFYEAEIERLRKAIDASVRPLASAPAERVDLERVIQLQGELRTLIADLIHYRLQSNALKGFQSYFSASEDAVSSHDVERGNLLRTELRAFMSEKGLNNQQEQFEGLFYKDVVADEALRWIKWLHDASENKLALDLARRLQGELFAEIIAPAGILAQAELDSWQGLLEGETGHFRPAVELVEKAIGALQPIQNTQRWIGILARAYNNLGYIYALQGRNHRSIEALRSAVPLWRALRLDSEQANTLNNLAFSLAEIGDYDSAHAFVRDGLRLRERQGPKQPVGLSLNTYAEINIRAFASEIAAEQAEAALKIFSDLGYERGRGLALRAMAEAKRRVSFSPTTQQLGRTLTLLEESEHHARDAVKIFREIVVEPYREVRCLIELGCVYREWFRWRKLENPEQLSPDEKANKRQILSLTELFERSHDALTEAAEHATTLGIDQQLDAQISLAWLLFNNRLRSAKDGFDFQSDPSLQQQQIAIEAILTPHFGSMREKLLSAAKDGLLVLLGDWEALLGEADLRFYRETEESTVLISAAEHCFLSLTAYATYTPNIIRQSRRTRSRLYEILKTFHTEAILKFYDSVDQVENRHQLINSQLNKFLTEQFGPRQSHIVLDL